MAATPDRRYYVPYTRHYVPKGFTAGSTYPLGDLPTLKETDSASTKDRFLGFRAVPTGEKRAPKKGEWYLSGATVTGYRAAGDLQSEYMIAKLVRVKRVPAQESYRVVG